MKEYYKIGEISNLYNIGADSLRYYEEVGILKPQRDSNGYRMYSIIDIRTLNILRELRSIGFSMSEIKNHLSDFNLEKTTAMFENAMNTIDQKVKELNSLKAQLSERIDDINYHTGGNIKYDTPIIKNLAERHLLKLSDNILRDDDLDFVIKKLQSEYENQLYIIGNGDIGASIPLEYLKGGNYGHFDSAFYIVEPSEDHDAVLAAGDYLSMTVRGSYAKIPPSWTKLLKYAESIGLTPIENPIELYLIDNHDTGDESEYVTELQVRISS